MPENAYLNGKCKVRPLSVFILSRLIKMFFKISVSLLLFFLSTRALMFQKAVENLTLKL